MATTLTSSTLTVTINETINLNSQDINSQNQLTVTGITSFIKRIENVPFASEITLLNFSTSLAAGTVIAANVKYLRITNKDNTNFVRIRLQKNSGQTFDIKLEAGKSYILGNPSESANTSAGAFSAFVVADSINAQADTGNVDIEMIIATI